MEDQNTSVQREIFIFEQLNDKLNNSSIRADLFRFWHTINDENTFEVFSFFQLSAIALNTFRQ